jgi:hypothetical protein
MRSATRSALWRRVQCSLFVGVRSAFATLQIAFEAREVHLPRCERAPKVRDDVPFAPASVHARRRRTVYNSAPSPWLRSRACPAEPRAGPVRRAHMLSPRRMIAHALCGLGVREISASAAGVRSQPSQRVWSSAASPSKARAHGRARRWPIELGKATTPANPSTESSHTP